jgi:hypothetical protein
MMRHCLAASLARLLIMFNLREYRGWVREFGVQERQNFSVDIVV